MICRVKILWDEESSSWYTVTDDVPGLHLDSKSIDDLVERFCMLTPEMLEENLGYKGPVRVTFEVEPLEMRAAA
ncbi:MAG: DUF1902 domain-containing protein [Clostridiales bacterium]|jgi:hypothetical protein|nr:DUF1902 domain-containing protein [Clostridiales bacterium]